MSRLSKEQWIEARALWESDPALTFAKLARALGISRPAVSQMAAGVGWRKVQSEGDPNLGLQRGMRNEGAVETAQCNGTGFVYVLEADASGVKYHMIGRAKNVCEQLSEHQASSPFELRVVVAYMTPDMAAEECAVHSIFADKGVRGKWFQLGAEDFERIAIRSYRGG